MQQEFTPKFTQVNEKTREQIGVMCNDINDITITSLKFVLDDVQRLYEIMSYVADNLAKGYVMENQTSLVFANFTEHIAIICSQITNLHATIVMLNSMIVHLNRQEPPQKPRLYKPSEN